MHFMAFKNASNVGTIWNLLEIWRKIQLVRFKKVRDKMCQNNLFGKKFPESISVNQNLIKIWQKIQFVKKNQSEGQNVLE